MVLIAIRAPLLSLCITIISVIGELSFLTAALTFMRYNLCRRLQRKQKVTVRSQHCRVLAVTLFAMVAFVCIETVTSIFADPQTRKFTEIQPCSRTILGSKEKQAPKQGEALQFKCTVVKNTTMSHSEGNFSIPTGTFTCADQPAYSYDIGERIPLKVEGSVRRCQSETCAYVMLDGDILYSSGPSTKRAKKLDFMLTKINRNAVGRLDEDLIAESLSISFANATIEEGEIRRIALMGSINGTCPFSRDNGPGTTIPLGVIIGAAIIWASSLLFFVASLFVRRRIFFDITNPMHWARRVSRDIYRPLGTEPELELEEIDGEQRIIIIGYTPAKGH